jgi:hypothetical protein
MKETLFGGKDWVSFSAWSMAAAAAAMASSSPWQRMLGNDWKITGILEVSVNHG